MLKSVSLKKRIELGVLSDEWLVGVALHGEEGAALLLVCLEDAFVVEVVGEGLLVGNLPAGVEQGVLDGILPPREEVRISEVVVLGRVPLPLQVDKVLAPLAANAESRVALVHVDPVHGPLLVELEGMLALGVHPAHLLLHRLTHCRDTPLHCRVHRAVVVVQQHHRVLKLLLVLLPHDVAEVVIAEVTRLQVLENGVR